jgi:hypothetical protein
MEGTDVIGALDEEERAIIAERDGYRDRFRAAATEEEQRRWLSLIEDATRRYDALRSAKWERGEVR